MIPVDRCKLLQLLEWNEVLKHLPNSSPAKISSPLILLASENIEIRFPEDWKAKTEILVAAYHHW